MIEMEPEAVVNSLHNGDAPESDQPTQGNTGGGYTDLLHTVLISLLIKILAENLLDI